MGCHCFTFIYTCTASPLPHHTTELYFILQHKVWLKSSAEQQFVYGHNVLKTGLARISESTLKYQGVVVYSMNDIPLVSIFEIEININYKEVQVQLKFCFLTYKIFLKKSHNYLLYISVSKYFS